MKESFLIVDGLNYLFRAYFGIPDAAKTKKGNSINAIYGFFSFLRKTVEYVNPKYLVIIFDSENAAKNKQKDFKDYKSNREYEDTGMFAQLRIIKEILNLMKIKYLEEDKIEADDLIGTYCKFGKKSECIVYISSNDFDFMQLISENVFVLRNFKGKQQIFTKETVIKQFGIIPSFYADYAALLGDKSDNIEGIKGIGKKTACEIINKFNTVENLINNIDQVSKKFKDRIKIGTNKILLNKRMIVINTSINETLLPIYSFEFSSEGLKLKTSSYISDLGI
jgi:DNA polymerase-1